MKKSKMIPFEPENELNTMTLMEKFGLSRDQANQILWSLFDQGHDLMPELNEEKVKALLKAE